MKLSMIVTLLALSASLAMAAEPAHFKPFYLFPPTEQAPLAGSQIIAAVSELTGKPERLLSDGSGALHVNFGSSQLTPGATYGSQPGWLNLGRVVTTTPPTYVEGTLQPASIDAVGRNYADISALNGTTVGSLGATSNGSMPGLHPLALGQTAWSAGNCANGKDCALSLNSATGGLRVESATADGAPGAARTNPPVPIGGEDYAGSPLVRIPKVDATGTMFMMTPGTLISGLTAAMTATTTTPIIAGVASNYTYITQCTITNSHASVGTVVILEEESSGTDLYVGYAASGGGGFSITFPAPLKVPTVAKGINALNVTTGSNTYASCSGFRSTVSY
jgi:hypothetical protein